MEVNIFSQKGKDLGRKALLNDSVFKVDPNEHVYPMAVKGGAMKDMFLSKTERT